MSTNAPENLTETGFNKADEAGIADDKCMADSALKFVDENGRTYHSYKAGSYHFPNDYHERDRLDFQHEIFKSILDGRLYFSPLKTPKRILDLGTGTGIWAIEIGDELPSTEVQGIDLSPIQPSSVPENVHFFIDDASEEDWAVPPDWFDFIHHRALDGSFTDFKDIIRKAFYHTKHGGWTESQEFFHTPYCDDGTMPADWPLLEWANLMDEASTEANRPLNVANKLKRWYEEVGFVDVQQKVFKVPINTWPKEQNLKRLGRMSEKNLHCGLSGFTLGYFSRVLNWNKTQIEVYLVNVRRSISDTSVHAYRKLYVVYGRKPVSSESSKSYQ